MLAGAETDKVGQGTGRSPGIRAFAGITPESRHPLPKNQNTYQSIFFRKRCSESEDIMRLSASVLACVVAVSLCAGEPIDIRGVVKDSAAGSFLSGAIVRLAVNRLADTTDASGAFALVGGTTGVTVRAAGGVDAGKPVFASNGQIRLQLSEATRVMISANTVDGRMIYKSERMMPAGKNLVGNCGPMMGVITYRILAGKNSYTLQQVNIGDAKAAARGESISATIGMSLAKIAAGFADTIVVSKTGFDPKRVAVSTATKTGVVVELARARRPGMRLIPGGTFMMGQTDVVDPVHKVTVSSFWMDTTEVTQEMYKAVMDTNPSIFTGNLMRPVEEVCWFDAVRFCNKRSLLEGKDTVYSYTGITLELSEKNYVKVLDSVSFDMTKNGYRLPTDAEWEYACRAGTTTYYYWGDSYDSATVSQYAWYNVNSGPMSHPVAQKKPNAFGLYDMSGNVSEWCQDWSGPYSADSVADPTGAGYGAGRVLRGGNWLLDYIGVLSANRGGPHPGDGMYGVGNWGFRCVCR